MWLFRKKNDLHDEELVRMYFTTGNKDLVGDLFERHVKSVFGACLFYFGDKDRAKDAVMEIFEKLIVELKRAEVKNFRGWLSFVVRNHCISELRKDSRYRKVPDTWLEFEVTLPDEDEEEKISRINDELMIDLMKENIPLLKEKQARCITMFYLDGKSYEEIASATGYTIGEVKSYIQNGKRNLKLAIEAAMRNTRR